MKARDVVDMIKANVGFTWHEGFRDTFKVGNPDIEVKGIATTVMSTFDQIKRAHAAGMNMVITHEPTFWSDGDSTKDIGADPVFLAKSKWCIDNGMVVWRFHDNWHARNKPDMERYATALKLGLVPDNPAGYPSQEPPVFTIPETTLGELAARVKRLLNDKTLRVAGDPKAKVRRIVFGVGSGTPALSADVDVAIGGEGIESDTGADSTEYARDGAALGMPKGFIIMGHLVSEEPGMDSCADWLRTFIKGVPIRFVPAGEPFWA